MSTLEHSGSKLIVTSAAWGWGRVLGTLLVLSAVAGVARIVKSTHEPPIETTIECIRAERICTITQSDEAARNVKLDEGASFVTYETRDGKRTVFCPELRHANGSLSRLGPLCPGRGNQGPVRAAMQSLQRGLTSDAPRWSTSFSSQYTLDDAATWLGLALIGCVIGLGLAIGMGSTTTVLDKDTRTITLYRGSPRTGRKGSAEYRLDDVAEVLLSNREVMLRFDDGRVRPLLATNRLRSSKRPEVAREVAAFLDRPVR